MKKIYKYLLLSILTLMVFSCQDDWLAPKPLSIFTPESIYVNEEGFEAALLICRKGLRREFYGAPNMLTGELNSTDVSVAGVKASTSTHNYTTQVTPTSTGEDNFFIYWNEAFGQIKNANVIISRINDAQWKLDEDKNAILGEAYFHRAYWYYRLVHQFGDVPFLGKEYVAPKLDFYSFSRKTILAKIQEDLEFAVLWLPVNVDPGKVNRAAGNHLLTKVCLANSQFDKAVKASTAVINDGVHSLMTQRFGNVKNNAKFNVVWDLHQKENKSLLENTEKILVVQDKYGYPDAEWTGGTRAMRNYVPAWWAGGYLKDPKKKTGCTDVSGNAQVIALGRGVAYSRSTNYHSYEIWKDPNDLRHDADTNWMPTSKILYNNPASAYFGKPVDISFSTDTFQAWFPWPQYKLYIDDEELPGQPYGGHSDWYVFRVAETYLLRAEAYYWKGDMANAASDINKVRERSGAAPIAASDVTIGYILDERARELFAEEPRKTELNRISYIMADNNLNGYSLDNFSEKNFWFDRITEKNNFYNVGFAWGVNKYVIMPYHIHWPVPANAIDSNTGGRINQNKGYPGVENNITPKTEITEKD